MGSPPEPHDKISYVTDIEGNWEFFVRFIDLSEALSLIALPAHGSPAAQVDLQDGWQLVVGGDCCDKGGAVGGSIRVVSTLVELKRRYPTRVTLILGNRDGAAPCPLPRPPRPSLASARRLCCPPPLSPSPPPSPPFSRPLPCPRLAAARAPTLSAPAAPAANSKQNEDDVGAVGGAAGARAAVHHPGPVLGPRVQARRSLRLSSRDCGAAAGRRARRRAPLLFSAACFLFRRSSWAARASPRRSLSRSSPRGTTRCPTGSAGC